MSDGTVFYQKMRMIDEILRLARLITRAMPDRQIDIVCYDKGAIYEQHKDTKRPDT
jgi:hypothetical protein